MGVRVLLRQNAKGVINARLFVIGGTANYPLSQQGIEAAGSEHRDEWRHGFHEEKTIFKTAAERIGTSFGYSSDLDYSEMNMTCVKPMWEKSWALFTDAILNPAFSADEFDLIKGQMVSDAKQNEADPDQFLTDTAMSFVSEGVAMKKILTELLPPCKKISVDDAKKFYNNTINKSHCILVVVGNITQDEVDCQSKRNTHKASCRQCTGGESPRDDHAVTTEHC